ncbi:hypothetical protein IFR04_009893 [Cadophora malorum]|uniref:Enoyl-CoA hydratase n=1 Tax=Cadophora malorum TaxID=108018 RepID=A0A8H7TBQ4_9HELO|nr:hypothetical protein IFR04_009893 [Cadophora malorum]
MSLSWLRIQTATCALLSFATALELPEYVGLKTSLQNNILEITLHNPNSPINVWNLDTQDGLADIVAKLQQDNETKVVIFKSDVPRYFMGHLDLTTPNLTETWPTSVDVIYNISTLPQVTIGAVEGRARGAGNELLSALDMRFATKTDVLFGQPEVASGLIPGGGGSQFLPGLIGRGRAMEYILSSKDITASEAEKIGWINKAFETSTEMYEYIDVLTERLRLFPLLALRDAKVSINRRYAPSREDLLADVAAFAVRFRDPIVQTLQEKGQALAQNVSDFEIELNLGENVLGLYA